MSNQIMFYNDLGEFVARLEQARELVEVRSLNSAAESGKALRIEQGEGQPPLLLDLFGSERRITWALGVDRLDTLTERMENLLDLRQPPSLSELMSRASDMLRLTRRPPANQRVPAQEVLRQSAAEIRGFIPAHDHTPLASVIVGKPDGTLHHAPLRRIQWTEEPLRAVLSVSLDESLRRESAALPAAVVFGGDPAAVWAGQIALPPNLDVYLLAAWLRSRPVELATCRSHDLEIPAAAEMVIEGKIHAAEIALSSTPLHITVVTHRHDALYPVLTAQDRHWLDKAAERLFLPVLRLFLEDLSDINISGQVVIASLKRRYPGAAQRLMYGLWGIQAAMLARTIIVTDDDVNVHDQSAVTARVQQAVNWSRDLMIVDGAVDTLAGFALGAKIGIDATRKSSV